MGKSRWVGGRKRVEKRKISCSIKPILEKVERSIQRVFFFVVLFSHPFAYEYNKNNISIV